MFQFSMNATDGDPGKGMSNTCRSFCKNNEFEYERCCVVLFCFVLLLLLVFFFHWFLKLHEVKCLFIKNANKTNYIGDEYGLWRFRFHDFSFTRYLIIITTQTNALNSVLFMNGIYSYTSFCVNPHEWQLHFIVCADTFVFQLGHSMEPTTHTWHTKFTRCNFFDIFFFLLCLCLSPCLRAYDVAAGVLTAIIFEGGNGRIISERCSPMACDISDMNIISSSPRVGVFSIYLNIKNCVWLCLSGEYSCHLHYMKL